MKGIIMYMKHRAILGMLSTVCMAMSATSLRTYEGPLAEWAVVGAGVAGISALGALGDAHVPLSQIIWIDRDFKVGRMGEYYTNVPANNKARHLVEFWRMCKTFTQIPSPAFQQLLALDPAQECTLSYIVAPLQDVTDYVLRRVRGVVGQVDTLEFVHDAWDISVGGKWYRAKRVILAIGAHPRSLGYACEQEIPLDLALDKDKLSQLVTPHDTVAVVGGAHSAVLIMKFLCDIGVARIINFYRTPLYYLSQEEQLARAVLQNDPLSGTAAEWAREVLDKNPPAHLIRIKTSDAALKAWMPICTKIVYAAGYERNPLPSIVGATCDYNPATGIIGPHLFGLGLAFPEYTEDGRGNGKFQIGVRDFMRFVQRMMPEWMHKSHFEEYEAFNDVMNIVAL